MVVVNNRVGLNGVKLSDEKAVHVKRTTSDHEVFWRESFRI